MFHVKPLAPPILMLYNCSYGGTAMGKTVSIFNQKGGVGKTTTCVNFAAALGQKGKKTLLVDCDPQGNSTSGVGVDKSELEASTYDVLINDTYNSFYMEESKDFLEGR